jgi:Polyketide cyclase / dehydrase and lipid transport
VTVISASATVAAPRPLVFAYLADWRNHWELTGERIELVEIAPGPASGMHGTVAIRGPLGLRRRAQTELVTVQEPRFLGGTARIGSQTRARVGWSLDALGLGATRVVLSAAVTSAGGLDTVLLLAGGKIWIEECFFRTIELLDQRLVTRSGAAGRAAATSSAEGAAERNRDRPARAALAPRRC